MVMALRIRLGFAFALVLVIIVVSKVENLVVRWLHLAPTLLNFFNYNNPLRIINLKSVGLVNFEWQPVIQLIFHIVVVEPRWKDQLGHLWNHKSWLMWTFENGCRSLSVERCQKRRQGRCNSNFECDLIDDVARRLSKFRTEPSTASLESDPVSAVPASRVRHQPAVAASKRSEARGPGQSP